ncbi:MAG: hypothetical protein J3Q66DRAFT_429250 [Benniella sp.]|nr:MAG: hypothetical protein J3Q66DRAFT_408186 [Benniella sp.]KAK3804619.1 MAG: hypothetical protein J3Q66DRAFT_408124 [Benniella sp.]KAK3804621.1 MAG: hypothetical protein J3Q66DRAFT_408126 [Benniella sp.]KAK3804628.1 MAG: hypothetical protein J3Q66DRAFT_408131 [Benniella sp.]KAK3820213.1 MAG: hypothetical protein J3Q66DRAFT_399625 [Benniella sp.]
MSKLLLKVKHGTKRPLPKRPLPLKVDKYRDKHRLGVTTSPRGSNIRKPYHARRQQQYQQETTHPEKIVTCPQDGTLKQIEFQQRPCLSKPLNDKRYQGRHRGSVSSLFYREQHCILFAPKTRSLICSIGSDVLEIQCQSKEHFEIMVAKDDKNRQRSIPRINVPDFA